MGRELQKTKSRRQWVCPADEGSRRSERVTSRYVDAPRLRSARLQGTSIVSTRGTVCIRTRREIESGRNLGRVAVGMGPQSH